MEQKYSFLNKNVSDNFNIIVLDSDSETQQQQGQNTFPQISKKVQSFIPNKFNMDMIEEGEPEEQLRKYEWIQSSNEEEFEIMKNICYLDHFVDLNDDLTEQELIQLDIPQFLQFMGNSEEESSSESIDDGEMDDMCEDYTTHQQGYLTGDDLNKQNSLQMIAESKFLNQKNKQIFISTIQLLGGILEQNGDEMVDLNKNELIGNKLKMKKQMSQNSNVSSKEDDIFSKLNQKGKTKKYQTSIAMLAQDQFIRITKYGDIALTSNIARRNQQADYFYDQDDSFIDDDQVDTELKQLALCEANYDDFFMIEGGLRDMVKSNEFKERLKHIQEYRDTKKLEIHLKTDKKDQKQKVKESKSNDYKEITKDKKSKDDNSKQKLLFDNEDEDDEDKRKKGRKNQKVKTTKLSPLHLKQPAQTSVEEKLQNKKMIAEIGQEGNTKKQNAVQKITSDNENAPSKLSPINVTGDSLVGQQVSKQQKKSSIQNKKQSNDEQNNTKQNKKKSTNKQNENNEIKKNMIVIQETIQNLKEDKYIIINEDDNNKTNEKSQNKKNSTPSNKNQKTKNIQFEQEAPNTSKPDPISDHKKKNSISIILSSQKKNPQFAEIESIQNVSQKKKNETIQLNLSLDLSDDNKQQRTRSQRNAGKNKSIDKIDSTQNLLESQLLNIKKINIVKQNPSQKEQPNSLEKIAEQVITKGRSKSNLNKKESSSNIEYDLPTKQDNKQQDLTKKQEDLSKQNSKQQQDKSQISLVNNKLFLEEQPLEDKENKFDITNKRIKRKIILPQDSKKQNIDMIQEESENVESKQNRQSNQVSNSQNSQENKDQVLRKKIIRSDKRKRQEDIQEEVNIQSQKADKKVKDK